MYSMTIRIHNNTKTHDNVIQPNPNLGLEVLLQDRSLPAQKGRPQKQSAAQQQLQLPPPGQGDEGLLTVGSAPQEPGASGWDHRTFETLSQDSPTLHLLLTVLRMRHRQQVNSNSGRCPITLRSEAFRSQRRHQLL